MDEVNNIIIRLLGETELDESTKAIEEQVKVAEKLEEELADIAKQYIEEKEAIKSLNLATGAEDKMVAKITKKYKTLAVQKKANVDEARHRITVLEQNSRATELLANSTDTLRKRLTEIRNLMAQMEEADNLGEKYEELAVEGARLYDQAGDLQTRINILASDTLALDAALSAGSGLAGAFNTATSAMAVFGGESDALQDAFYKVQAVISTFNGLQEVANALNKESAINVAISAKATKLSAVAKAKEAVATGTATKAQKALNYAMLTNPFAIILTSVVALVSIFMAFSERLELIGKGIRKLADSVIGFFSPTYKAARQAELALKAYDLQAVKTATALGKLAHNHDKAMRQIESAEREQMNSNAKRHATTLENYEEELKYLKQKRHETINYTNKAIVENNKLQKSANDAYTAAVAELSKYQEGTKKYEEALQRVNEAQKTMNDTYQNGVNLQNEQTAARQAVIEKEQQIADEKINRERQRQQAVIDIMKEGAKKEKEQVRLSYQQQLQEAGKGTALWKALKAKENKELQDIDKKYNYNTQQLRIDVMRDGLDKELKQLELSYEQQLDTMEKGTDLYNATIAKKKKEEKDIRHHYDAQILSEVAEQLRLISEENQYNYDLKKEYYEADAEAQIAALDKEKMSDLAYANAVVAINKEKNDRIKADNEKRLAEETQELQRAVTEAEHVLDGQLFGSERVDALNNLYDAQIKLYDAHEKEAEEQYKNGTISFQDYQDRLLEIEINRNNASRELTLETINAVEEAYTKVTDHIMQWFSVASDIANSAIQSQMDQLEEMYTTDAEEAAKDANKKYITEKELDAKKRALQNRQARIAKAQAILEIGLGIPKAIMETIAQFGAPVPPNVLGITAVSLVTALGAAQLAAAMAKPISQYAKGRKGGPGEFALVGEKGPELMYVPQGASIVPNNKLTDTGAWGAYGIPKVAIPDLPYVSAASIADMYGMQGSGIDYDKLGKAVASNMPKITPVSVNVDRRGITVNDGRDTHTYLNIKYARSWN